MTRRFIVVCILFCQCLNFYGQFLDDFSDDDLNESPIWEGDLQDFIVNASQELQLNAGSGDLSQLYTQLTMPDSIQWDFEILMDFSPSNNNRLRVYLAINGINPSESSGYYLEVGENGNNDALNFYYLSNGESELLGTGQLGALATEPVFFRVSATYFPGGEWLISTSYEKDVPLSEEIETIDSRYDFQGIQIFMLECNYTSSRSDKFFFDNVGIKKYEVDKTGPEILSVNLTSPSTLVIQANEQLDQASVQNTENYAISPFEGQIESINLGNNDTEITLELNVALSSGIRYKVVISSLQDRNGNVGKEGIFDVFVVDQAGPGDLLVNEILFNPETGGYDFVEIFNRSEKFIDLGNLSILNADRDEEQPILSKMTINPGDYLCLTENVSYLIERYETPDTAKFLIGDIPGFNNDVGNVSIINTIDKTIIDAFDYSEKQHFSQLEDLNGVSLERISPDSDQWFSASASVNYATPGYQNSVFLKPGIGTEETFSFENKTFSPNQDGADDQLVIRYKLPDNGYLVDINIFDQYGRKIRTLVNNELLGGEGFLLWDGVGEQGEKLSIGIYFVVFEAYNTNGTVLFDRKPAILADFLD